MFYNIDDWIQNKDRVGQRSEAANKERVYRLALGHEAAAAALAKEKEIKQKERQATELERLVMKGLQPLLEKLRRP